MKANSERNIYFLVLILFLFAGCATVVEPTGGPKDVEHPLIVESKPANYSVLFKSKEINISFNEFIDLKDLNQYLIVSPPIKEKPIVRKKGKTLQIKFEEKLEDSTTYNIYFGNSIVDFNEGNPIENFQYVLSTGTFIDSLSIEGKILNAFNLLPEEGVFVLLYNTYEDSIPLNQIPRYVAKTNKDGLFRVNNISHNQYKLFCLRDLNKNYLFDMPDEDIAFIDSLIKFELVTEMVSDTIYKTSKTPGKKINTPKGDTLNQSIDSIISYEHTFYSTQSPTLKLFKEYRKLQYLANSKRESKSKIEFMFNKPLKDSLELNLADTLVEHDWFINEINLTKDTIIYWITDSVIYNKNELKFVLEYQKEDSNMVYQLQADTLKLRFVELKKNKKDEVPDTLIKYSLSVKNNGVVDLNKKLDFNFEKPIASFDESKFKLFTLIDSLELPVDLTISGDKNNQRKLSIYAEWVEDTKYRLEIYPSAFTDIYNFQNDTSIILFTSQKLNFYGKVLADIQGIDSSFQIIAQLILPSKDKEEVYLEKIINKNQIVEFPFLPPKEFIFKIIIDKNFNNTWDTGKYLKHIQPEEVLYHVEKINVRSNWDIEINFNVNKK